VLFYINIFLYSVQCMLILVYLEKSIKARLFQSFLQYGPIKTLYTTRKIDQFFTMKNPFFARFQSIWLAKKVGYVLKALWKFDWLFTVLRPAQEFFSYMETSPLPVKGPMLGAQRLWAGRDLYRATPTVTRVLSFSCLIRRTAPFSRLLRHMRGCGGSITRILTGLESLKSTFWCCTEYFSEY
jgi:hypothetical protein